MDGKYSAVWDNMSVLVNSKQYINKLFAFKQARWYPNIHFFINHNLLISEAWQAAPKPLSIFTTETPLAQLFSIESNADNP